MESLWLLEADSGLELGALTGETISDLARTVSEGSEETRHRFRSRLRLSFPPRKKYSWLVLSSAALKPGEAGHERAEVKIYAFSPRRGLRPQGSELLVLSC